MLSAIELCILAAQLAVATPVHTPVAATAPALRGAPIATAEADPSRQTLGLINGARAQQGLPALDWNDQVAEAAQRHAELLVRNRRLSHQFADEAPLQKRLTGAGLRLGKVGENVAVNYDAKGAHAAFLHSPDHRANILNGEFDQVGVAVVRDGDLLYFVEDFAHRRAIQSNSDAARVLANRFAEIRKQAHAKALREVYDTRVQDWACAVAQDLRAATPGALPGARFVLAFSEAEGDRLPAEVSHLADVESVDRYAVGVCYSRTSRYPAGRYFVTMVLFAPDAPWEQGSLFPQKPLQSLP
jgi:uncharacterized protein YkwD